MRAPAYVSVCVQRKQRDKGVAKAFELCSDLTDQYRIVLGNKHWAFSFVNLLKHIINPGTLFFLSIFSVSLSTCTHTHTHLSRLTRMCQQKLSLTAAHCASTRSLGFATKKREKVVRMNICITMSASGLPQCQPFKHRLREDLWIIKGLFSGMLEEVAKSGFNYYDWINFPTLFYRFGVQWTEEAKESFLFNYNTTRSDDTWHQDNLMF